MSGRTQKTKRLQWRIGRCTLLLALVVLSLLAFDTRLSVRHMVVQTAKINEPIKLALVTDLHSCDYGEGMRDLIDAVQKEQPDAVVMAGDIFDDDLSADNTMAFIRGIAEQQPCYYVTGNHEFWSGRAGAYKAWLAANGVRVLTGNFVDVTLRGNVLRIGGLDDPEVDNYERALSYTAQFARLASAAPRDVYTILLAHRPERIAEYLPLGVDLVLAGHAHGGQWRLPVLLENGLVAPDQGWFPAYTNGAYFFDGTEMIVSRGLARESIRIPRIFNRPEFVIITLAGTSL